VIFWAALSSFSSMSGQLPLDTIHLAREEPAPHSSRAPHIDIGGGCDWDLHDEEASRTRPIDLDQDDSNVHCLPSLRGIVVELGALRDRVAQLEAQQLARSLVEPRAHRRSQKLEVKDSVMMDMIVRAVLRINELR